MRAASHRPTCSISRRSRVHGTLLGVTPARLQLLPTEANPSAYPARRMMGPAGCCLLLAAAGCWLLLAGSCLMPAYCWQLLLAAARR